MAAALAVIRLGRFRVTLPDELPMWPVAILCAPLAEELVYRSLFVPGLVSGWGERGAVVISAGVFYLLHLAYGQPLWMAHYVAAGAILSWAFVKRRRLWICVLLHAGGNALVMTDDVLRRLAPDLYRTLLG